MKLSTATLALLFAVATVLANDTGRQNDWHKEWKPLFKPTADRNIGKEPRVDAPAVATNNNKNPKLEIYSGLSDGVVPTATASIPAIPTVAPVNVHSAGDKVMTGGLVSGVLALLMF